MKIMSVVAVKPIEGHIDKIVDLITQDRKSGIEGLEIYTIVHSREGELVIINQWSSIDSFVNYVHGPHNMIELIENFCERYDEENVSRAYSGAILHQEMSELK